jgi:chromate transporter
MGIYSQFFSTFFRIGLFTLGGGYAMIPLIEEEVVNKRKWIDREAFLDLLAVAQTIPGVFAVNMSINIGYRLRKTRGAVTCALGCVLPSFLIILAIALFFHSFRDNKTMEAIFKGIRPAVVALIAAPCIKLARSARITLSNVWLPVGAALLIWLLGVSPVYIILAVGIGGYMYGRYVKPHE